MNANIGLQRGTVRLLTYDPAWVTAFQVERRRLLSLLSGLVVEIAHVGSTAVPGICAKPVIDMLVSLTSFELVDEAVASLVEAGYDDRGSQEAGRRFVAKGPEERRTHYLHLVGHDSAEWHDMLLFRNYLLEHDDRALAYANLKRKLTQRYASDRDAYAAGKDAFIKETLALAMRA